MLVQPCCKMSVSGQGIFLKASIILEPMSCLAILQPYIGSSRTFTLMPLSSLPLPVLVKPLTFSDGTDEVAGLVVLEEVDKEDSAATSAGPILPASFRILLS